MQWTTGNNLKFGEKRYVIYNCSKLNSAYKANSKGKWYIHSIEHCTAITWSPSLLFTITYNKMENIKYLCSNKKEWKFNICL